MNRTFKTLLTAVALSGVTSLAVAAPQNLGDLIANNGTITIGDKIFGNFSFQSAQFNAGAGEVDAYIGNGIIGDVGVYYLKFNGPWTASGGEADILLGYTVETTSGLPLIAGIDQAFVLSAQGNGGTVAIGETVFANAGLSAQVAQSSVGFAFGILDATDPEGEILQGDDLIIDPPLSKVWVLKDIALRAETGGLVGATGLIQSFHQVPDGGSTLMLLGAAFSVLAMMRRKP